MEKIDIRSLSLEEIQNFMIEIGEKKFRGLQIYQWINNKLAKDFDEMTNLSKELREKLKEKAYMSKIILLKKSISKDGSRKYLFEMKHDHIIEAVLMRQSYGNSVCVSSQVGCKMGCTFCASTINGLERSLTPGEILSQIYEIQKDIGERVSHVVLMGSGEPFDNYDNIMKFIRIVISQEGLNISQRHITVSTSGILDKIYDFADENTQVNLALSLHAPNDETRRKMMPIAKRHTIEELLKACKYYTNKTNRRITYEYALVEGFNDTKDDAHELARKIKGTLCHVNLIPVNKVEENDYMPTSKAMTDHFLDILKSFGIETTVRKQIGSDINAACGQLRKHYKEEQQL
jgi:23S rRNA (adenine2503-C2)-methyltransferase